MGHTLRGNCAWEEWRKGRKPKTWMWLMCSQYRNEYSNLKLLGSSEEVWLRWTNLDCNIHMHGNNTRNLSLELSLSQTSKNAMFFLYLWFFFFNKIEQEGGIGSARRQEGGTNNVYTCKYM
jgi:hypothetical protein